MTDRWSNIEEAYPELFPEEATTTANVGAYPRPLGPVLRRVASGEEKESSDFSNVPEEYLRFLGLK